MKITDKPWIDHYNNKLYFKRYIDSDLYKIDNWNYSSLKLRLNFDKIYVVGSEKYGIIKNNKIIWNDKTIWYKKIYDRLELYYTFPYGPFYILSNDKYIAECMKNGISWEKNTIIKLREYLKKCKNVIDIGGHVGTHSIPYSKYISGTVFCFEAQFYLCKIMLKNIELNECDNIVLINRAVGHLNNYTVSIFDKIIDYEKLSNGIQYNTKQLINYGGAQLGKGKEEILMRSIDSYNFNDIDFIKIDIEGSEELALYGALDTIKRCRPIIMFESRCDKYVNEYMKEIMPIDENIISGNTIKYIIEKLDYRMIEDFDKEDCNCLMIPN